MRNIRHIKANPLKITIGSNEDIEFSSAFLTFLNKNFLLFYFLFYCNLHDYKF